jgi:hypothetical protein
VQWLTSNHDWLYGAIERVYLISMIDGNEPFICAFCDERFNVENMHALGGISQAAGLAAAFYDKAALFQIATEA